MTSLIDVIFLLLMFFMLATSFSRTTELPLAGRASAGGGRADPQAVFLRLTPEGADLNGSPVADDDIAARIAALGGPSPTVLVALGPDLRSQRLADVLARLRAVPGSIVRVLE